MNKKENITVVIPSFNRAHLLKTTIPTYLQPGVKEVIIIDDCSQDNTSEVVQELQIKYPDKIRYFRQKVNSKQPAAKNKGIELCDTEWIYFGDDDSILVENSIEFLYTSALSQNAEIAGARALYMKEGEQDLPLEEAIRKNTIYATSLKEIVDIRTLTANFNLAYKDVVEVPFCHACLLMKSNIAKDILFDVNYIGNAYREETDFIVRCTKAGSKVIYDSRAIQYNLPSSMATGGARGRSKSMWKYKWQCIRNNWRFLKKNWRYIQNKYQVKTPAWIVQLQFSSGYITRPLLRIIKTGKLYS